ncbi:MAG: NAD(P)-dependent alcohol dehydrogenase, partial [Myxococcaceae bacterium]
MGRLLNRAPSFLRRDFRPVCWQRSRAPTYGAPDPDTRFTQGGYTNKIVVNQDFVLRAPTNIAPERIAPLLCAGITTYSPL